MNSAGAQTETVQERLLRVESIGKSYLADSTITNVLNGVTFNVDRGETMSIVGPSGAGKSTLLNILGTLDHPSSGTIKYRGEDLFARDEKALAEFRNRKLGFVFQFHHLLPEFTALENVMMPARIAGIDPDAAEKKARQLLGRLGLDKRLTHKQGELSGGEQQRVAVARALVMEPEVVLADEPTGNLDTHTGRDVFDLMLEINRELNMTLIVVTHNMDFARKLPRCITLVDGSIIDNNVSQATEQ